jgi:hypothetical protein
MFVSAFLQNAFPRRDVAFLFLFFVFLLVLFVYKILYRSVAGLCVVVIVRIMVSASLVPGQCNSKTNGRRSEIRRNRATVTA